MAQVVSRIHVSRQLDKVSVVSLPGQPLVQLMRPAAEELATKAPGKPWVGASGPKTFSRMTEPACLRTGDAAERKVQQHKRFFLGACMRMTVANGQIAVSMSQAYWVGCPA